MKPVSCQELDRQLAKLDLQPLYLLIGNETYLRDRAARSIADAALKGTLLREFNESSFSLLSDSVSEALAVAAQLPMLSERRVVRLKHFSKLREAEEELLIRYLDNPCPSTVAIFIAEDLDKRKAITRAFMDNCQVVDFPVLKDGEARAWAKARLEALKTSIDEPALRELISLVGPDVQTLFMEIDKLATAAIPDQHISKGLVESLIGHSRELSNFELGDQLIAGDRKRALQTLGRLLADEVAPVLLLGLIASNYHRLAVAKELLEQGSREEVYRMVPSFKRSEFLSTVQRTSREKLADGLRKIAAADLAIKTSQATPRLQLEMLVCDLAGK